jgi:hypothetical protein
MCGQVVAVKTNAMGCNSRRTKIKAGSSEQRSLTFVQSYGAALLFVYARLSFWTGAVCMAAPAWTRPASCSEWYCPFCLDTKGTRRAKRPDQREEVPVGCDSRSKRSRLREPVLTSLLPRYNSSNSLPAVGQTAKNCRPLVLRAVRADRFSRPEEDG